MSSVKSTLVLGASLNPSRYANKAILKLRASGHPVFGIGMRSGMVGDVEIQTSIFEIPYDIHTVSIYLRPDNQRNYEDKIVSWHPKRVIFNPGAENSDLADFLKSQHILVLEACTLVLLANQLY